MRFDNFRNVKRRLAGLGLICLRAFADAKRPLENQGLKGDLMTTEYLLHEQLDHVLAALTPANELVCRALLATGLRISDVLTLKPEQIKRNVWVTEAKTGKPKQIGFSAELRDAILAQSSARWAFPSPKDPRKHRTRQAVWADLKRAAAAFRLPQNVAPHSMRKVYAVELRKKYGDIERVRKALNHDREATTLLYALADHLLTSKPRRWKRRHAVKKELTKTGGAARCCHVLRS